jgi:hypothetical protein
MGQRNIIPPSTICRFRQFPAPAADSTLRQPGNPRDRRAAAPTEAIRLKRRIPAALLVIQGTHEQVHLLVLAHDALVDFPPTFSARTDMNFAFHHDAPPVSTSIDKPLLAQQRTMLVHE